MNASFLISTFPDTAPQLARLVSKSDAMKHHRVFGRIRRIEDLRTFMAWHAFAVWDFMSLVKRLQIELTCTTLPWTPPRHPATARLINEIVLGEETDLAPGERALSHFDLYLEAMDEVGADTRQIRSFAERVAAGVPVPEALSSVGAPAAVREFVSATIALATQGSLEQVLGSFVFGREDAIPDMFQDLLRSWQLDAQTAPTFVFYLQRHIELDGDEHGPAAQRMLMEQVDGDPARLATLLDAAEAAVDQRIRLWDALAEVLQPAAPVAAPNVMPVWAPASEPMGL